MAWSHAIPTELVEHAAETFELSFREYYPPAPMRCGLTTRARDPEIKPVSGKVEWKPDAKAPLSTSSDIDTILDDTSGETPRWTE